MLRPVMPVINYYINYDYIVAELCENKAKPVLKCNGKCHLTKELKKANNGVDQTQNIPPLNMKEYPVVPFLTQAISLQKRKFKKYSKAIKRPLNSFIDSYYSTFFQPPKFIS